MGVGFPAALAAWYRIHDGVGEGHGAGFVPSDTVMLPLEEMIDEYRTHVQEWELGEGLLPLTGTTGDMWSGWYVDAREGEPTYGCLGQWSVDGGDEPYPSDAGWALAD